MSSKRCASDSKSATIIQILLLCIAVGLPIFQWQRDDTTQWGSDLRALKLERLRLIRALGILRENGDVVQSVSASHSTVESMTLSLIESIKRQSFTENSDLTQLTVTTREDVQAHAGLNVIRVKFSVLLSRAISLLAFFDAIKNIVEWRPIEVRGCSVLRVVQSDNALNASCVVDVYYFPEIDN